jgi:hypothetical protein
MITLLHYDNPKRQHAVTVIPDIRTMKVGELPRDARQLLARETAKHRKVGCIQNNVEGHMYFTYRPDDMASMEESILAARTVSHALVQYSITLSETFYEIQET